MDITGENHLRIIVENIQKKGITVLMSGLNEQPEKKMKKTGLYDKIGAGHFFPHTNNAIAYALDSMNQKHCEACQKVNGNECVLARK